MSKRGRKGRKGKARRRYGHFGMADIHHGAAGVRKLASENPEVTAAAVGAASAALVAGMKPGTAAMIGAVTGIAAQQAVKRG